MKAKSALKSVAVVVFAIAVVYLGRSWVLNEEPLTMKQVIENSKQALREIKSYELTMHFTQTVSSAAEGVQTSSDVSSTVVYGSPKRFWMKISSHASSDVMLVDITANMTCVVWKKKELAAFSVPAQLHVPQVVKYFDLPAKGGDPLKGEPILTSAVFGAGFERGCEYIATVMNVLNECEFSEMKKTSNGFELKGTFDLSRNEVLNMVVEKEEFSSVVTLFVNKDYIVEKIVCEIPDDEIRGSAEYAVCKKDTIADDVFKTAYEALAKEARDHAKREEKGADSATAE